MKTLKELIIEKLHINKDTGKDEIIDEVNDIIYKIQKSDNDVSMVFKLCEYINESSKILKYLNDLNYEISIEPRFKGWGTYKEAGYVITIYDKNLSLFNREYIYIHHPYYENDTFMVNLVFLLEKKTSKKKRYKTMTLMELFNFLKNRR